MSFSKCDLITLANFSNGKNNEYVFSLISLPDAVRDIPSRGVVVAFLSCKLDVVPVITNTRKREREKKKLSKTTQLITPTSILMIELTLAAQKHNFDILLKNKCISNLLVDALRLIEAIFG